MHDIKEYEGLDGNIIAFKEEVADAEKITFAGAPGVCAPFAELFAYAVRDKESVFITLTDIGSARKLELTPQGMQMAGPADPHADVVALLGGLSLPKTNVKVEDVKEMVNEILNENGKLIGLSYMGMFNDAGWDEQINFNCILDGTLTGVVKK